MTVNFFVLQVMSFIHLFSTYCRTGNILSAGGKVMTKTRFPVFIEKTDKTHSNNMHWETTMKNVKRLECLRCSQYRGQRRVLRGANI